MSENNIVILNGARTAMGGFQGSLAPMSAPQLGGACIREAVARAGLQAADVEDVVMGCVLPAGLKQGPARQAMRLAGLPDSTGATTINKLCGSGMRATMFCHDMLKAGSHDIVVSGGMESMSNAPYILDKARGGYRMGHGQVADHMFLDGLEDAETGRAGPPSPRTWRTSAASAASRWITSPSNPSSAPRPPSTTAGSPTRSCR